MALVRGRLGLGSGLRVRARVRVRVRVTVRVSSYLPRGLLHCAVPRMVHVGERDAPRLQPPGYRVRARVMGLGLGLGQEARVGARCPAPATGVA